MLTNLLLLSTLWTLSAYRIPIGHASMFRSKLPLLATESPPEGTGQGEWADWDNNSFYEDEYVQGDEEDEVSIPINSILLSASKMTTSSEDKKINGDMKSASDNESNDNGASSSSQSDQWSEEAPYFDEADVQDDEGNWGRSVGNLPTAGSSSVWMSRTEYAEAQIVKDAISSEAAQSPPPSAPAVSAMASAMYPQDYYAVSKQPTSDIHNTKISPMNVDALAIERIDKLEGMVQQLQQDIAFAKGFFIAIAFSLLITAVLRE
jgi:hypothetical protein